MDIGQKKLIVKEDVAKVLNSICEIWNFMTNSSS